MPALSHLFDFKSAASTRPVCLANLLSYLCLR